MCISFDCAEGPPLWSEGAGWWSTDVGGGGTPAHLQRGLVGVLPFSARLPDNPLGLDFTLTAIVESRPPLDECILEAPVRHRLKTSFRRIKCTGISIAGSVLPGQPC